MSVCPTCRRPLPESAGERPAVTLRRLLLEALRQVPEGLTTHEVQAVVGRRLSTIRGELAALAFEGLVVRDAGGQGRGWRTRRWRLAQSVGFNEGSASEALAG